MERIIVKWYKHTTKSIGTSEFDAPSLTDAIDIVRQANDFEVVCLGAEYKYQEAFIKSIQNLNQCL